MNKKDLWIYSSRPANCISSLDPIERAREHPELAPQSLGGAGMDYKETFWMACDSTEQLRAEYGPFHTRAEAEAEARKLGFSYLLRYEHMLD